MIGQEEKREKLEKENFEFVFDKKEHMKRENQ